jgi:hypothetical protein
MSLTERLRMPLEDEFGWGNDGEMEILAVLNHGVDASSL